MRLVQSAGDGGLKLEDTSRPIPGAAQVLVRTRSSLISSGTEKSVRSLASSSLLAKARSRPDLVREVVRRAQTQGVMTTAKQVKDRLAEQMPLGYSAAGTVLEVGEAVANIRPGQRVATAGAAHADFQLASGNLAVQLPDGVSFEEGAFGAVACVALHALRLAEIGPGSRVAVIGLGLVGQIATRLALASGHDVAGADLDPEKASMAEASGAVRFDASDEGVIGALDWTKGSGFDAVLVTAATKSSDPMRVAARLARDRASVIAVGDVGLDLDRRPLYEKELAIKVSRAYGPGRYEPSYEQLGIDYPIGFVRWPIGRNLEAVMNLIASGRLAVADLITHRFPFDQAVDAYEVFERDELYLGILLEYGEGDTDPSPVVLRRSGRTETHVGALASGLIGAGRFASGFLLPNAAAAGFGPWMKIHSATGTSAVRTGEKFGFDQAVGDAQEVICDSETNTVFIATRHDTHANYVCRTLEAGKSVFCEKPLAISQSELSQVIDVWNASSAALMVGFNRRWSPAIERARHHVGTGSPIQVTYRVHAGELPSDHWLKDRRQGGRILGEGCHFIDTCNALVEEVPQSVYAVGSGEGETLLQEDFTITLNYPSGSQAVIVYSSGAPRGAGKERVEAIRGNRSAVIDDYRLLTLRDSSNLEVVKYKPTDKGHANEFVVFRKAIEGRYDNHVLAESAIRTSQAALAAVESLMTGAVVRLD